MKMAWIQPNPFQEEMNEAEADNFFRTKKLALVIFMSGNHNGKLTAAQILGVLNGKFGTPFS
jgi:hypothetical protein